MRQIARDIVSALIVSSDNKIFMGQKDYQRGGVYPDCWHLPGGGVQKCESLKQALRREILEEVGIDINQYDIELIDDIGQGQAEKVLKDTGEKVLCKMHFNIFKVIIKNQKADQIKVRLNDDLVRYNWFAISQLNAIKLTPPSRELFLRLGYNI
ncbi:MAG: NUDIX hydrolase [Candidatus Doudnabacteria bacterium]